MVARVIVEYMSVAAVTLEPIQSGFSESLDKQDEEIDEAGDRVRAYDEWWLASVVA